MTVTIKSSENKEEIRKTLKALKHTGKLKAYKHCGKIKISEDPLVIQKAMRDEW